MPSQPANSFIPALRSALNKDLTEAEVMCCDEVAYHYYTKALCNFIESYCNRGRIKTFDHVYVPLKCGIMRGALRATRGWLEFSRHAGMYAMVSSFIGDGYPVRELDCMVELFRNAKDEEVRDAISIASNRNIRTASYVKGIILNARRKAAMDHAQMKAKYKPAKEIAYTSGKSNMGEVVTSWTKKLADAVSKESPGDVEREANKKLRI